MTWCKAIGLTLLLALTTVLNAQAAEPPTLDQVLAELEGKAPMSERTAAKLEATYNTVIGHLLADLGSTDLPKRQVAREHLKAIGWHAAASGHDPHAALAHTLAANLDPKLPRPALLFLLRQLETLGRGESVDAVAALLRADDPIIRERARITLQLNSSPKAAEKLRRALRRARSAEWQVALINALGARRDTKAVPRLIKHAQSSDEAVRTAAVEALAQIGDKQAVHALAKATTLKGSDRAWFVAARSYLLLADKLAAQGDKPLALEMYGKFLKATGHLKCAAVVGLGRAGGAAELPAILEAMADADPQVRGAGTSALDLMPLAQVRAAAAQAATASPTTRVLLLGVLARRGNSSALPTFIAAAAAPDLQVRLAAYHGIGTLGDERAVPTLLKALGSAKDDELEAVRTAIGRLRGTRVDTALVQAINGAPTPVRIEVIQLLAERRAREAVRPLLAATNDKDPTVRHAAFAALGALADANALPTLVGRLVSTTNKIDRAAVEKAIVAVCTRIADEDTRAEAIVAALPKANVQTRCALLRVLGRVAGRKALAALRVAKADANDKVRDAAVRALAEWQNATAAADLLDVARTGKTIVHHVLALRAYVRLVALPSDRPTAETLAMYHNALDAARRTDEKKLVLAGIADVPDLAALKLVAPFLADPALGNEAAMATTRIATAISGSHRAEAKATLAKVLEATKDQTIRKLASDALAKIQAFDDYVTAWEVSGPYEKANTGGPNYHDMPFAPENDPAKAKWKPMPVGGVNPKLPYLLDFYEHFAKENCVVYIRTRVWSPAAQQALLEFGSDDGAKVWLNGKLVVDNRKPRGFKAAEDKATVALKKGWNTLLAKVWNGGLYWNAALRLRKPGGGRLEGLRTE